MKICYQIGCELVPLMKEKHTGKPHKDPATGYMMSHGLSSTDVTKLADKKGYILGVVSWSWFWS